jgi:SAM-dependent methyltransferase
VSGLEKLRGTWESLAKRDALSAILTDDSKAGGKWDLAEFFATGEAEIDTVLNHLETLEVLPDFHGSALDFGCGVGRLTQAIARRFQSTVGVDISAEMIRRAESLNQHPRCRFIVNSSGTLPFADGEFAFIYCNIVLQHVPRRYATNYLREFVRVLADGGVLVFGVQDSFAAPDLASKLVRARHVLHLRSRIRRIFGSTAGDMQMHCLPERIVRDALGNVRVADIQLTNTAARDFNGKLVYLQQPPGTGYVGKQYCVVK